MRKLTTIFLSFVVLFVATGCGGSYYQVKVPGSDSTYYTKKIKQKKGGNIIFEDAKTGSTVNLQNSEVKRISKGEFKTGIKNEEAAPKSD